MNAITITAMAEIIRQKGPYDVWVGCLGYDTRPYVGADPLPVAHTMAFAEAFREPQEAPEEGLEEALASLEAGEVVWNTDYLGANYVGSASFVRTPKGFKPLGYRRAG